MSMQSDLEKFAEPYSRYHLRELPDSYSRNLDHQVREWEMPYGYDVRPLQYNEIEAEEMKAGYGDFTVNEDRQERKPDPSRRK